MKETLSPRTLGLFLCLVLLLLFVRYSVASFVFHPDKKIAYTPEDIGLEYEQVYFTTSDGIRLNGWYVPAPESRGTLLFFHGNAGNISHRLESLEVFHGLGLSVFIFDYRGYGESEGKASVEGTALDALAAWKWLAEEKGTPPDKIVVFGRSLGGAVAMELMRHIRPKALILESTFSSLPDMARVKFLTPLVRLLIGDIWNSEEAARTLTVPTLVIHSPEDEIVPFRLGTRLYEALAGEKAFVEIEGGHNEGFSQSMLIYRPALDAFLTARFGRFSGVSRDAPAVP